MRSQFKELKAIFPLINTMLLDGSTCTINVNTIRTRFIQSETTYFLEICIFKSKSIFSSLTIKRDLLIVNDETWKSINELKNFSPDDYICFDIDSTYRKIYVYIHDSKPKKELLELYKFPEGIDGEKEITQFKKDKLFLQKQDLLYNIDFFLRKDFTELNYFFPIFNLMIYKGAFHFVQVKTRNLEDKSMLDLKLKIFYDNQNSPSISVAAKLKHRPTEQQVSIYNFLSLAYSGPIVFNLNYLERHLSLQAYCNKDSIAQATEVLETVFFPS